MEIPQELKNAIDNVIEQNKNSIIIEESQKISKKYRENNGKGKRLVTEESEALAYAISRMPSTYSAVYSALTQTIKNYDKKLQSVFDIGAGTGAATWAISNILDTDKIIEFIFFIKINNVTKR